MESIKSSKLLESLTLLLVIIIYVALISSFSSSINAQPLPWTFGIWERANATFHANPIAIEFADDACGYGSHTKQTYNLEATAVSEALYINGETCGACYEIECDKNSTSCIKNALSIHITATNFFNPISTNPGEKQFDLTQPMFNKIALINTTGVVIPVIPVLYRRALCTRQGGIKFQLKGIPTWILVLVYNVGGVGDVTGVKVKGSNMTTWSEMTRHFGQSWGTGELLLGQGMSFQVTTSDGKMAQSDDVVPPNWKFNDIYEGKQIINDKE